MGKEAEEFRRALSGNSPLGAAAAFISKHGGPIGALKALLAEIPPTLDDYCVAEYCVVSLDTEHDAPCANSAVGDYLEFECDAPYIDQENWPKEVLLVCLNKAGQVVETQTVNVLEFVQDSYPQWLGEVED